MCARQRKKKKEPSERRRAGGVGRREKGRKKVQLLALDYVLLSWNLQKLAQKQKLRGG